MNKHLKISLLVVLDSICYAAAMLLSFFLTDTMASFSPAPVIALFVTVLLLFSMVGLYRMVLRFVGVLDCMRIGIAFACVMPFSLFLFYLYEIELRVAFTFTLFFFMAVTVLRLSFRFWRHARHALAHRGEDRVRAIIIGAGAAGRILLQEMKNSEYVHYTPVCFLDDDPNKIGMTVDGVLVYGRIDTVEEAAKKFKAEEILVAIPSASRKALRSILEKCRTTSLRTRTLPGMYQLVNGEVHINALRDVEITDLLGREQIQVDLDEIMGYIENHAVLVTGGGGSIGSELCRQIARYHPKRLIILDIYENNAYEIEQELRRHHPSLDLIILIASVRDRGKMEDVFRRYRPDIVFNAAAHKHVPLMEISPGEAIKNNVIGTWNLARMADRYGTRRFVQISTDKAVNPTNIMGASKRLCEMLVQSFSRRSRTEFVAVRFGNVLGSNGSVIPLFRQQIREGGPVTVTHKDIIRYFMTIPEAVSLVLQAGAYAEGGEIFVLDMGEPVRIYELAENLIRLSGFEPGVDIEIHCTGLRPGEKLYEERLMAEEGLKTTPSGLISVARPLLFNDEVFERELQGLEDAAYAEREDLKELVARLVPTYKAE